MAEAAHATVLLEPIVLLAAAVVAVPIAKRIGLGSVLGYIAAGVAVGPSVLGLFAEPGRGDAGSRSSASCSCSSSSGWS